ncbi:hypothetical protein BDZ89DRAFT_393996 [Hymenopellis radicata]|nr:hypothetical protein BDZ89DRAFT_393996 [Hymenopellis radicata]
MFSLRILIVEHQRQECVMTNPSFLSAVASVGKAGDVEPGCSFDKALFVIGGPTLILLLAKNRSSYIDGLRVLHRKGIRVWPNPMADVILQKRLNLHGLLGLVVTVIENKGAWSPERLVLSLGERVGFQLENT